MDIYRNIMYNRLVITEAERKNIKSLYGLVTEQAPMAQVPLLTVLATPALVNASSDGTGTIYLSQRDNKGQNIPNTTYKYSVKGVYDPGRLLPNVSFNVILRNVKRDRSGALLGEAQPSGNFMKKVMKELIPNNSLTSDGWMKFKVPQDKLNAGLQSLVGNQGKSATIDAGNGVKIKLALI